MIREFVKSSNIAAIGYDPETQVLEVQFTPAKKSGEAVVWAYLDVNPHDHETLIASESIGRAFGVIKGTHKARKVAIIDPDGIEKRLGQESSVAE